MAINNQITPLAQIIDKSKLLVISLAVDGPIPVNYQSKLLVLWMYVAVVHFVDDDV